MIRKRKMSKTGVLLLVFAMVIGLLAPVTAVAAANGTLNIHKLSSEYESATSNPSSDVQKYYEVGTNEWHPYLAGAYYTVYKIGTFSQSTDSSGNVSVTYNPVSDLKDTSGNDITALSSATVASTIDVAASGLSGTASGPTTATGALTITGLAKKGIYLIKETTLPSGVGTGTDFIITVPLYDSANSQWVYEVDAFPKNTATTGAISKAIKDVDTGALFRAYTANIGDSIDYVIGVTVPEDYTSAAYTKFQIVDTSSAYLDYQYTTDAADGLAIAGTRTNSTTYTLTAGTDYTAAYAGNVLTITLTDAGRAQIASKDVLTISYQAKVLTGALGETSGLTNSAKIVYTKNGGDGVVDPGTDPDPVVYIASYGVKKVDENGDALAGATFRLAVINSSNASGYDFLTYNTTTEAWEVDNSTPGTTFTTSTSSTGLESEAILQFKNLDKSETYYLVETAAPTNYDVLPNAVSIQAADASTAAVYNTYDADGAYQADTGYSIKIENALSTDNPGILPTTGGNGIYMFLIIGIVLMGGAAALYIKSRKSRKETD